MSALRQMLASLWAAVWLRWRMAGGHVRRVAGRRPGARPAMAGATAPSFYLPAAEIPAEGVDYDLGELPADLIAALGSVRADLAGAARGTTTRRARRRRTRRRRMLSLAMAALVTLAALGAGATALMTGSTGVPEVDRLLGIYERGASDPEGPGAQGVRPSSSRRSTSVEMPLGAGGRKVVATAYVGRDDDVCLALPSVGTLKCIDPPGLSRRIADRGGEWNVAVGEEVVLFGIVRGDVTSLQVSGPGGPLPLTLGEEWRPDVPGLDRVRIFVAIDPSGVGNNPDPEDYNRFLQVDRYEGYGLLEGGERVRAGP